MLFHNFFEQGAKLIESGISHVVEPAPDKDSVIWLELEVLSHIVYNQSPREVSSDSAKILDKDRATVSRMLTVEPVFDVLIRV